MSNPTPAVPLSDERFDELAFMDFAGLMSADAAAVVGRMRNQLVDEIRRLQAELAEGEPAADDTLPAWLYQRFAVIHGCPAWDRVTDNDRAYWERQARAVRRAVARNGSKSEAVAS